MKQVTIKKKKVLAAFNLLNVAKLSEMEDADKIKVFHILRALKPVATKYDEFYKDAVEKLKPEGYDEKILKWNECREKIQLGVKMEKLPMDGDDFVDMTYHVINPFNKALNDATDKEAETEVEVEFEPISERAFMKLIKANDWNVGQIDELNELVCE